MTEIETKRCKALDTFEDTYEVVTEDEATGKFTRTFPTDRFDKGQTYPVEAKRAKRLIKLKLMKAA